MSKTIRDNAHQAALSMMANEVLYATCRYLNKDSSAVHKTYTFKVTGEVLQQLIERLEQNRQKMVGTTIQPAAALRNTPITIEALLDSAVPKQPGLETPKEDNRILAVVGNITNENYAIVEVISLGSYLSVSDLETNLGNLRYLTSIVDTNHALRAQEREEQVIQTIARKLQAQAGTNFAVNLLGQEAYSELMQTLSIDNSQKIQ